MKTYLIAKTAPLALAMMASLLLPKTAQGFYNPSTGKWLSRDPIGERGALNLYGFVNNTPVNAVDRDGRQFVPPPVISGGVGMALLEFVGIEMENCPMRNGDNLASCIKCCDDLHRIGQLALAAVIFPLSFECFQLKNPYAVAACEALVATAAAAGEIHLRKEYKNCIKNCKKCPWWLG